MASPAQGRQAWLMYNFDQAVLLRHLLALHRLERVCIYLSILVQVLMPSESPAVLSLALSDCAYDVDRAVIMLRRFQVAKVKELRELEKVSGLTLMLGKARAY